LVDGAGYIGEYNVVSAFVFAVIGTFLFLVCILGVTHPFAPTGFAGLAIGLTLVVIHLVGTSPAPRSIRPARSARRWSASPQTRNASRSFGSSLSPAHRRWCRGLPLQGRRPARREEVLNAIGAA
jgi:glycerol uptake facilitator-like aquaporin